MLIQSGKDEGWLHLDVDGVKKWATAGGIGFSNASPSLIPGRGIGLVADRDLSTKDHGQPWEVLTVAEDLVLSVEAVKRHAQFDQDFRDVFESLGDFGRVGRRLSPHFPLRAFANDYVQRNLLGHEVCYTIYDHWNRLHLQSASW